MLELKRPLNGLKKNIYKFQDMSDNADNSFKVTDLPDKFLIGKNSFKIHLKEDVLVFKSQVYIDILDSFGNSMYYKIISDNLPNKERIVAVYVYDSTPIGECEIIIAGRLNINPKTGLNEPYSNDVSSPDYHGIPNVVWRKVIQINPEEVESPIYYSVPPTVTYSEIRKPQYQLSTNNRLITQLPTASSTATMYSNRGQMNTVESVKGVENHLIGNSTSSVTYTPITPINDDNEIASLYFSRFEITASMEGGRISFNNIPYKYPSDAVVTESKVLNYSGSIVKVIDKYTCYVSPPFYKILNYTDRNGVSKKLVIDGFRELNNFTASYYSETPIVESTSSYNSYIKLEITNAEPEIGSLKTIKVKAKNINKPGQSVNLGDYDVSKKNILVVGSGSYTMTSKGIEPLSLGDFRKLGTAENYWTGSITTGGDFSFLLDDTIMNGVVFPDRGSLDGKYDYSEMHLLPEYMPTVKKDTEYELSYNMAYRNTDGLLYPRQVDVYISGSQIETDVNVVDTILQPLKNSIFGTYIGSIDAEKITKHNPKFYFKAKETGRITPTFVHRSTGVVYADMKLSVRNEPGYSAKVIDLEVPLPTEFNSRAEIGIDLEYYNSRNIRANYGTSLYGVVFDGNTPTTGSEIILPSGLVSSSQQIKDLLPSRTISSSQQFGPTGIYSGSGQVRRDTVVSASNIKFESTIDPGGDDFHTGFQFNTSPAIDNNIIQYSGSLTFFTGKNGDFNRSYIYLSGEEQLISLKNIYTEPTFESVTEISTGAGTLASSYTSGSESTAFILSSPRTYFLDNRVNKIGIEYLGNYTSSLINNPGSLTDVRTVRKILSGSNLFISSSGQIASDISGSFKSLSGSFSNRLFSLEQATGSYATTGSNTFLGNEIISGSLTVRDNITLGKSQSAATITSSNTIGGSSNPAIIFDTKGDFWGNSQQVYSFRENGVEFFYVDGIGNVRVPQGNFTTANTSPESGIDGFIGHGMRRSDPSAGMNFAWGESISSPTEPGIDLFPIGNTHISNGILLRLSKNSSRTLIAIQVDGNNNVAIGNTGSFANGSGSLFIAESTGIPNTKPIGGSLLYTKNGTLRVFGTGSKDVDLSGSFSGSFSGNGSNITGILSSSYSTTSSFWEGYSNITEIIRSSYSISGSDSTVLINPPGLIVVTLPVVSLSKGKIYTVKKASTNGNTIRIIPNPSDTTSLIESSSLYGLTTSLSLAILQCDGKDWWVISGK